MQIKGWQQNKKSDMTLKYNAPLVTCRILWLILFCKALELREAEKEGEREGERVGKREAERDGEKVRSKIVRVREMRNGKGIRD